MTVYLLVLAVLTVAAVLLGRRRLTAERRLADRRAQPGMILTRSFGGFDIHYSRHLPGDMAVLLDTPLRNLTAALNAFPVASLDELKDAAARYRLQQDMRIGFNVMSPQSIVKITGVGL